MIGHLGSRTSALLDGQLSPEETERAWAHVDHCHQCRDLVEREGWIKTRLAGLCFGDAAAPAGLKGSLLGASEARCAATAPGELFLAMTAHPHGRPRRTAGMAVIGGGAVGAAVVGVLALGAAPADAPSIDRRAPVTSISHSGGPGTPAPSPTPAPGSPTGPSTARIARP